MKRLIFTILGVLIYCGLSAQEIPQKISYQGKLLENGIPVNGTKSITFTIGTWSETKSVSVNDGLYSVTLGETIPIPTSIFNNSSNLSLQISVEGINLTQTDILSVPYAYKAEKAVEAENVFSGNYNDLSNQPTIPTTVSQLTNDEGYITDGNTGWDNSYGFITSPDDADADATNELNTSITLNGTDFQITDAGGTLTADLSSLSSSFTLPIIDQSYSENNSAIIIDIIGDNAGICDFKINNASNGSDVLYAKTIGTGGVADFRIDNPNNTADVLYASTNGDGSAGFFKVDNTNNASYALKVRSNGQAQALDVKMTGEDNAGHFEIDNTSSNYYALYVTTNSTTEKAGKFIGDVYITGALTNSKGQSKIDYPLDPENKYLYHSFVESPDMMNVYNGNITTDTDGIAIVHLPEYFEALNKDFRYQLTCFGVFSQAIVYEKLNNNSFTIKTELPNVEVSWQITGIRQDTYAEQNRTQVVVEKSDKEKGHYLHYKEYNQPLEKSIEAINNPDILEELNENKED